MTEAEWHSSTEFKYLLAFAVCRVADPKYTLPVVPLSDRKLRLLLVGCCRLKWELFENPTLREAVEMAERFSDGNAVETDLESFRQMKRGQFPNTYTRSTPEGMEEYTSEEVDEWLVDAVRLLSNPTSDLLLYLGGLGGPGPDPSWPPEFQNRAASQIVWYLTTARYRQIMAASGERPGTISEFRKLEEGPYVHLLRCIAGNPFRPVAFDPNWRTETVVSLASAIYAERAFDRLPILADALEEAGCDHADILSHCRGPGPHARGCWVVDLVLGKE